MKRIKITILETEDSIPKLSCYNMKAFKDVTFDGQQFFRRDLPDCQMCADYQGIDFEPAGKCKSRGDFVVRCDFKKKTKRERIKEIIKRRFPDEKFTEYGMNTLLDELIAAMDESNDK